MASTVAAVDPNIKQVRLVSGSGPTGIGSEEPEVGGEAAAAVGGARGGSRKRSGHRKGAAKTYRIGTITKEGGGSTSPGTLTQLSASHVPGTPNAAPAVGVNSDLTQKGAPIASIGGAAAAAKPVKVVLAAAKKKKSKVILAAAAAPASSSGSVAKRPAVAAGKTRKASRKIRISMAGLSRKIHRAKTIRHKASSDSLDTIKKALQKAGLIKADSKAPEYILRQMYADFMTLKNRAL